MTEIVDIFLQNCRYILTDSSRQLCYNGYIALRSDSEVDDHPLDGQGVGDHKRYRRKALLCVRHDKKTLLL